MSRPKPQVILDHTDAKTYKSEQVLMANAIYAVFYDSKPINLRTGHALKDYPFPKYKKTSFCNPGHAFNLATKLNNLFKTNKFQVFKLTQGVVVDENTEKIAAKSQK